MLLLEKICYISTGRYRNREERDFHHSHLYTFNIYEKSPPRAGIWINLDRGAESPRDGSSLLEAFEFEAAARLVRRDHRACGVEARE